MSNNNRTSYSEIFKTTFLFGFVQLFKAIVSIVKNKLVAILIGTEGMGLLGVYNSTLQMIQTGAGLGISQSAVRDVAQAFETKDNKRYSQIISVTNRIVLLTGLLGCIITLVLSRNLSQWTLGSTQYTVLYCILGVVVALNIINDGKQAVLKGTRSLKSLAYASMLGSTIGLVTAVPLYYFFGIDGIVPELLIASILAVLVTQFFVRRIQYDSIKLSIKEVLHESKPMVQMGIAMMIVSFLGTGVSFIINAFIRYKGGLQEVGLFNAGSYVINGYFGMIITALMTDYYPRIAANNQNNEILQDELNKQSMVSVILCGPLILLFISLMPLFINLLYTSDFLPAMNYLKFGIFWTVITICSNQVDMILVAKNNTRIFLTIAVIIRLVQVLFCLLFYNYWGLLGLGIAYGLLGCTHLILMSYIVNKLYGIHFNYAFLRTALPLLLLTLIATFSNEIQSEWLRYSILLVLTGCAIVLSVVSMKKNMGISIYSYIINKIKLHK